MSQHFKNDKSLSRRNFLKGTAVSASVVAGAGILGGCAPKVATAVPEIDTSEEQANSIGNDWLGEEPVIEDISETLESDVIVIGAGTGGLYCAASCLEKGLKVIVLEKNSKASTVRDDFGSIDSKWQLDEDTRLDKAALIHYHTLYSANRIDQRLAHIWADESGAAVDWYGELIESRGAGTFNFEGGYEPDFSSTAHPKFPTGHSPTWNEGKSGSSMLQEYIEEMGGEFHFEIAFVKFEHEGNKVTAVIARDKDERYIRFTAEKSIVLSTGGYQGNPQMMEALQPDTTIILPKINQGINTGDGIKACLWMGCQMDECHSSMLFDRLGLLPGETPATATQTTYFLLGSQPWLKVNLNGERFTNESVPYDYLPHAAATQPGKCYCCIFDTNWFEQVQQFQTMGCSRIFPFPNGSPNGNISTDLAIIQKNWQTTLAGQIESGHLQEADTIEELATKLQIPEDSLAKTVSRYNELAENGVDEDFYKEAYRLLPLTAPPYYGMRTAGRILTTIDGIRIDTQMRPVDKACVPFEGLHVIGDSSGGFFAHTYPSLYTGLANGRTLTYARRVARILAGEELDR